MTRLQGHGFGGGVGRFWMVMVVGSLCQLTAPHLTMGVLTQITESDFDSPQFVTFDGVTHLPFQGDYIENGVTFGAGVAVIGGVLRWANPNDPLNISVDTPINRFGFFHFSEDLNQVAVALEIDSITTFVNDDFTGTSQTFDFTNGGNQAGLIVPHGTFWGAQIDQSFQSWQMNFDNFFTSFMTPTAVLDDFRYGLGSTGGGGGGGGSVIPEPSTATLSLLAAVGVGLVVSARVRKQTLQRG